MDESQLPLQLEPRPETSEVPRNLLLLGVDEIYEQASPNLLMALREDRRLERKLATYPAKALGDYFSMWANTEPDGGLVVIGQADDGALIGCTRQPVSTLNELERTADVYCPDARVAVKRIPFRQPDGTEDFVMLFRVRYRKDRVVETVRGQVFTRRGESKTELYRDEIRELQVDKGQVDHELEPCNYAYPDDFDQGLIRQFVSSFLESREMPPASRNDEEVLEMRHLGEIKAGSFVPNTACALLFARDAGKHFPGCKIRFLRYDGEHEGTGEKFNAVKDVFIEGPLPRQIAEAEKVLDSQLREFARLGKDQKFIVAPEYPKAAWYEAIVNACVHRSYIARNMNIFVKMFDDRLVVESPGGFPPGVTAENIYHSHHPRNPHLMNAMFYLRFVKCVAEGTKRMRDSMSEMKLPTPEFRQTAQDVGPIVRVTLRNNIKQRKVWIDSDAASLIGETIFATLSQDERRAINHLAEYGSIGVSELQRLTSRTWTTAKKTLARLEQRGLLTHDKRKGIDRDPNARYVLKTKKS